MKTAREIISDCLNGKHPIERTNPQPGQSKFYYISPQGNNDDTSIFDAKTIDIPDNYISPSTISEEPRSDDIYNNVVSDILYFSNYDYDQRLLDDTTADIKRYEGSISYPYLDTKGYITTGNGSNVNDWEDFNRVNWLVNGRPATEEEKRLAFNRFEYLKNPNNFGGKSQYGQGIVAGRFKNESNLEIDDTEAQRLMQVHLRQDLRHVRGQFPDFDRFPQPLKKVLLDIQYNTGKLKQDEWPELYKAISRKNISDMANEVHRSDVSAKRNKWARDQILSIPPEWAVE